MNYYSVNNSNKGSLNLSSFVFAQIAKETLEELAKGELKDSVSLKLAKNRDNVTCDIDHNQVRVDVSFSAVRNSDVQNSVDRIQKEIYEAIYDATEIGSVKVNVAVVSFVDSNV